jgi:hypothetical protein
MISSEILCKNNAFLTDKIAKLLRPWSDFKKNQQMAGMYQLMNRSPLFVSGLLSGLAFA